MQNSDYLSHVGKEYIAISGNLHFKVDRFEMYNDRPCFYLIVARIGEDFINKAGRIEAADLFTFTNWVPKSTASEVLYAKTKNPKYHAGQALMTDMGNIFTIKAVTKTLYELTGHKVMNTLPISYIDKSEHIKPATKAGRLLYERFKKTDSL